MEVGVEIMKELLGGAALISPALLGVTLTL